MDARKRDERALEPPLEARRRWPLAVALPADAASHYLFGV
jgi:hypothetical protein